LSSALEQEFREEFSDMGDVVVKRALGPALPTGFAF